MNKEKLAESLISMGQEVELKESVEEAALRRARIAGHLQGISAQLVKERSARRIRLAGFACAAAILLSWGFYSVRDQATSLDPAAEAAIQARDSVTSPLRVQVERGEVMHRVAARGETLAVGVSQQLENDAVLEIPVGGSARVQGGRGLDIHIAESSQVSFTQPNSSQGAQELTLRRGTVNCSVEPSGTGMKLAVVTPDARVVVKGTIFSVKVVELGTRTRTCVRVEQGIVAVTREGETEDVAQGESSGCSEVPASAPLVGSDHQDPPVAELVEVPPAASSQVATKHVVTPNSSSLALQNGLFARGLAAEREGQLLQAERELSRLLQQYPETPLRTDVELALRRIVTRRALEEGKLK